MSGSPVYAEDGRLIGAVAYGLSWGPSDVAGITPFEEMDNYLPDPPAARVKISDRAARKIAARTDVSPAQAQQGFRQLRVPLGVSGVSQDRVTQGLKAQKDRRHKYLPKNTYAMGAAAPGASDADDIVAGGNLAVSMSYGDITQGGVGTATSICDGGVVGFGHPATFLGTTTMSMHPADVLYVQEDPVGPSFKVANLGAPVGTISGDHLSGVSGMFGALPPTTTVTSAVDYKDRSRTGSSFVSVPESSASVTFYQQLANHDRVLDGIVAGSELMTWTVSGDDNGRPFELGMTDRYASNFDIAFESPWDVADTVYFLSALEGVTVDEVLVDGTVDDDSASWRVKSVEQKVDGDWVKVSRSKAVIAKAGKALKVRALLSGPAGEKTVPLTFDIPQKLEGKRGNLSVTGGAWTWQGGSTNSVEDIEKRIAKTVRNDAVEGQLYFDGRRNKNNQTVVSDPTDRVVNGGKWLRLKVR